jgi:hypothetical protein
MNLRSKIYLEAQKASAERQLADRLAALEGRGWAPAAIQRDPSARRMRAAVRKVDYRLRTIAAKERQYAEKARVKEERAAGKDAAEGPPAETPKARPAKRKAGKEA